MNPPQPNIYDPCNAQRLCLASADAYHSTPDGTVIDYVDTETRAVITVCGPGEIIIAFRGTEDFRNWITDLYAAPHNFQPGLNAAKVHAGFQNAWLSIEPELSKAIRATGAKKFWLTGHSLGGALALLAAADWLGGPFASFLGDILLQGIYTFGQPRVGNGSFVSAYDDAFKAKTFRVVDSRDIVPHVPWLLRFYRHAGHEVFYSGPGGFIMDRPLWAYFLADMAAACFAARKLTNVESWIGDHFVNKYLALFPSAPSSPLREPTPVNN